MLSPCLVAVALQHWNRHDRSPSLAVPSSFARDFCCVCAACRQLGFHVRHADASSGELSSSWHIRESESYPLPLESHCLVRHLITSLRAIATCDCDWRFFLHSASTIKSRAAHVLCCCVLVQSSSATPGAREGATMAVDSSGNLCALCSHAFAFFFCKFCFACFPDDLPASERSALLQ